MDISSVDICNMSLLRINQGFITSLDDNKPQAIACKTMYEYSLRALMSKYPWNFLRTSEALALIYNNSDNYNDTVKRYDERISDPANAGIVNAIKISKQNYINEYNKLYFPYNCLYELPDDFLRLVDVLRGNQSILSLGRNRPAYDFQNYNYLSVNEKENGNDVVMHNRRYGLASDYNSLYLHYVKYSDDPRTYPVNFIECLVMDLAIKLTKQFNDNLQFLQGLVALYEDALSKAKIEDCQQTIITYGM